MNISIVTVYDALNVGAYLQAYGLHKFLSDKGHDVTFLQNKSHNSTTELFKKALSYLLRGKVEKFRVYHKSYLNFKKDQSLFEILPNTKENEKKQDLIILGSDEIWNISRRAMSDYPVFWGVGVNNNNIISYAPSSNNSTKNDVEKFPYAIEGLHKLKKISVRDFASKRLIEKFTDKEVSLVCDPTMLLDVEVYDELITKCKDTDYILVYDPYNRFSQEERLDAKKYAKSKGKKLISMGAYLPWCDKSIPASASSFLTYFKNADIVFTSTFHGTMFSLIFNKNFVIFSSAGTKVIETLDYFGLKERVLNKERTVSTLSDVDVPFEIVNPVISEFKEKSRQYLIKALKK